MFTKLVVPSLFNQHPTVRTTAVMVIVDMYKILGEPVKILLNETPNLKPNLLDNINSKLDEIAETYQSKYLGNDLE